MGGRQSSDFTFVAPGARPDADASQASTDFSFASPAAPPAPPASTTPLFPPVSTSSTGDGPPSDWQFMAALPRVQWNLNPSVTLKLRKHFHPLGVTRLTLGADYALDERTVTFKWSWRDRLVGARLHFERDEVSLSRRFTLDQRTTIDASVGYDVRRRRALCSFVVRPLGGVVATAGHPSGLAVRHSVMLDKRVGVEAAATVRVPEARFSTGSRASVSLGDGDFIVDLTELNIRFQVE